MDFLIGLNFIHGFVFGVWLSGMVLITGLMTSDGPPFSILLTNGWGKALNIFLNIMTIICWPLIIIIGILSAIIKVTSQLLLNW